MLYLNDGSTPRLQGGHSHAPVQTVWVDLLSPTDAERSDAERLTGLRVPSLADLEEIESSSRVYEEDGVLYFSLPYVIRFDDQHAQATPVGFVLSATHLLTLRYAALPAFEGYAERFARDARTTSQEAFIGLLEAVVDRLADGLEKMSAELDRLSKATFQSANGTRVDKSSRGNSQLQEVLGSLGLCGDTLGHLRDSVIGIGRIVAFIQRCDVKWLPRELAPRIATLREDIASLNDYDQQLYNKVAFLLQAVLGFINIEQNNGVKVLTVVSVVGIPPTFVVGYFGMNLKMPEFGWEYGYPYGIAMILISIVIPLVWFRKRGWM